MDEYLSTKELGWVLGRSVGSVRTAIKRGEINGVLLPGGYRVARDEVLRVSREHVEAQAPVRGWPTGTWSASSTTSSQSTARSPSRDTARTRLGRHPRPPA